MRVSPHRHTLAVLRTTLGLHQKEMADIAGCARVTIQKIELLQLRLTEDRAERISKGTGCNLAWLLANNLDAAITNLRGETYTQQDFDDAHAALRYRDCVHHQELEKRGEIEAAGACRRIVRSMVAACANGRFPLWIYRIEKMLNALELQFMPHDKAFYDYLTKPNRNPKRMRQMLRALNNTPWSLLEDSRLPKCKRTGAPTFSGIEAALRKAIERVEDELAVQYHRNTHDGRKARRQTKNRH